ncbi:hypothetical protein [Aquipuribacter sp. MA13-6]|uniref:hypothetical protein n=1 Tax=unclassified Aquipuribacter TaxID=2635084 RepID=UPI003EE9BA80
MPIRVNEKAPNVPVEERAATTLRRHLEAGTLDEIGGLAFPSRPRYLVTYMNSQTGGRVRSATLVSVTNQSDFPTTVTVSWYRGFSDNSSPVGTSTMVIPPDYTVDFGSRDLPSEITAVNSTPNPELTFDEGRAVVQSRVREIGVSARVVYTSGDRDEELLAITDSKVVRYGEGNTGD